MRVLVTGSRDWPLGQQFVVNSTLHGIYEMHNVGHGSVHMLDITFVVGDCPTGVDSLVRGYVDAGGVHPGDSDEGFGCRVLKEVHYADWDRHGKAAGPIRNQAMVDSGADLCVAFFNGTPKNHSGTSDCRARAIAAGISTYTVERWR